MLTLLKIATGRHESAGARGGAAEGDADRPDGHRPRPHPAAADDATAAAVGVSVGIISALNRIWGKALQTDAKVSPTNYGGPLVDLEGRVQGILVPASPRAEGETAGFEWYDSGIGFAIPLEDINAVLPRLKQGQETSRAAACSGVDMNGADMFEAHPVIASIAARVRRGQRPASRPATPSSPSTTCP